MENEGNEENADEDSEIDKSESEEEQEENEESENSESNDEELKEDKDLVEHAVNAVEHISSETAQEMDESAENENMKKVEAALFIAGRFLTLQELVMLTDINPLMLREILEKLIEKYNDNSGIEIVEKSGSWKMDVGQEHVHMINKLATGSAEFSKAEQETLAVIAYKQPVKQSVIIKIRGNKAYDHIKHFIDINLVQAKKSGRTRELRLSDDFFEYFHLQKKGDGSTEIIGIEKNEEGEGSKADEEVEEKQENEEEQAVEEESEKEEDAIEEMTEQEKSNQEAKEG